MSHTPHPTSESGARLPSYLNATDPGPWAMFLQQLDRVEPHLGELAQEGMTMMCVTHEMGFARRVADRVVFMDAGRIVEDRPKAEFFDSPQSERAQQFLARILHH